jgi:hypothetical protein
MEVRPWRQSGHSTKARIAARLLADMEKSQEGKSLKVRVFPDSATDFPWTLSAQSALSASPGEEFPALAFLCCS